MDTEMRSRVVAVALGLLALVLASCNSPIDMSSPPPPEVEVVNGMFHVKYMVQTTDTETKGSTMDATRITFHSNYIRVEIAPMGSGRIFPVDRLKEFGWTPMTAETVVRFKKAIETFKKASESSSESPDD